MSAFDPAGPAVSLGNSDSIFPNLLAQEWSSRGMPSAIVTSTASNGELPGHISVVRSQPFERLPTTIVRKLTNPFTRRLERWLPRWQQERYARRTGRPKPEPWEWYWVDHFWDSFSRARAALSLRPRFVFAHEASSYGLSAALCRGVPRIIFPWGGDVFNYVESSFMIDRITTYALKHVDLVVPASVVAAQYIRERFGLAEDKVQAVPWGVDLKQFSRASPQYRSEFCQELGIDPATVLILNSRRFRPFWGCSQVLEAFLQLAQRTHGTHFLLLTGSGAEENVEAARRRIEAAGLASQFTFFIGNVSLSRCAEVMSVADIFVSLAGRGDMRSSSVVQATACGGAPVILEAPEYREMAKQGFTCEFVRPDDVDDLTAALGRLVTDEGRRLSMREQNRRYVTEHEDYERQMTRMLDLIGEVSRPYQDRLGR